MPKQFACLFPHDRSLMQEAITLLKPLIPADHILVVYREADRALALAQLAQSGDIHSVMQPRDRGSASSLVLSLANLLEQDHEAHVVIVPAAHVVGRPETFLEHVAYAEAGFEYAPITLLGAQARSSEPDHAWMVPGRVILPNIHALSDFVVAPSEHLARQLLAKKALWSTQCLVAEASTLWRVTVRRLPRFCELIREGVAAHHPDVLARAFDSLDHVDFYRSVVARQLGLALLDVTSSDFMEIATPTHAFTAFPHLRRVYASTLGTMDARLPEPASAQRRARQAEISSTSPVAR